MQLNDHQLIEEIFTSCQDVSVQKQLAFMLGRQQIYIEINESTAEYDDLIEIMANCHLNNHFLNLAREVFTRTRLLPIPISQTNVIAGYHGTEDT